MKKYDCSDLLLSGLVGMIVGVLIILTIMASFTTTNALLVRRAVLYGFAHYEVNSNSPDSFLIWDNEKVRVIIEGKNE